VAKIAEFIFSFFSHFFSVWASASLLSCNERCILYTRNTQLPIETRVAYLIHVTQLEETRVAQWVR